MNTDLSLQYVSRPANKENAPLLILIHGYGSNEQDLFSFAPQMDAGIHIISLMMVSNPGSNVLNSLTQECLSLRS